MRDVRGSEARFWVERSYDTVMRLSGMASIQLHRI